MTETTCPRCHHRSPVRRRSRLWWAALVSLTIAFVVLVLAAGMIGPFIVGAVPFLALVGFAFGPLHSILREEPTCPRCGRTLVDVAASSKPATRAAEMTPSPVEGC
ncbi:MAG: hypothetical protein H6719_36185 [Sandaracinaceae bacterium]|nr:hypothetical protein [Sandaracinaceae bacterium]